MQNASLMEIKRSDVKAHEPAATEALRSSRYSPSAPVAAAPAQTSAGLPAPSSRPRFDSHGGFGSGAAARPAEEASLTGAVRAVFSDDPLPNEAETHVLRVVRSGIAVSRAVLDLYGKTTELDALKRRHNEAGRLGEADSTLFSELQYSASLIGSFVACSYVAWGLAGFLSDAAIAAEAPEPAEFRLDNPPLATAAFVWELSQVVKAARDEASLAKLVRDHCARKAEALALRATAAKHLDRFTGVQYRIEGSDFTVKGFEPAARNRADAVVMQFRKPEEVVGNHIAKSQALRLAKMLASYDPAARTSPFVELGGHIFTFMGDGFPGTGKTTLIQMICGLLHDFCAVGGYGFRYQNFGVDQISEFQGLSGRNCKSFIEYVLEPGTIGFGTIDDIDQIAGKRGDRQSSGGQQEVTAALMDAFAGANTVVRGNCSFGMFSNYPENVDDALRQRAGARFLIDGPQTFEDYRDLFALLLKRELPTIGTGGVEGELFATQRIKEAVRASYERHGRPQERKVADVFDEVVSRVGPLKDMDKLSRYLHALSGADPRFTGRAVKNIADAVKTRAMDFDMPDEWFERPETFMHQPMARKVDMIRELMLPVTAEMVLQQINLYADSEARYGDKSFEAARDAIVRDHSVRLAAQRIIQGEQP